MAASGHKTINVFKRYNTASKEEIKTLVGERTIFTEDSGGRGKEVNLLK
jgi:hypothetical protein